MVGSMGDLFTSAAVDAALPAAGARLRPDDPGRLLSPPASGLGHTADVKNLLPDLAAFQPTFMLSVPRVFEKVYNSAAAQGAGRRQGQDLRPRRRRAIAYSEALDQGGAGLALRLQHGLFDRLVYGKLRAALGGRVPYAVSGGAPLGARLGHFFRGIGVTILEGYGLTETTAGGTRQPAGRDPRRHRRPAPPGQSIRIADDGEVLIKGGVVFRGYYNNPDGDRRGDRRRRLVPHRRHRRARRRRLPDASPAARRS